MKLQHIRILLAVVLPLIIGVCVSIRTQAIGEPLPPLSGTKAIEYLKQNRQYDSLMEAFEATRKGQTDETPTGDTFEETAKLTASDGFANDVFGLSVAISGETAIIGATGDNNNQGSAYIFVRSGTTWSEQQKLTASDGAANDFFGSVAILGDTAIVGAVEDDVGANTDQGSAYVFVRSGTTWSQQQKLTASDGAGFDFFGGVAISGETAIVGASQDNLGANTNQGSAYIFVRSGTMWSQQQKLTAADGAAFDAFGTVAISGETAIIGAYGDDIGANSQQGSAYVFVRSGSVWSEQQKLTASDGRANDRFGSSVALSGETAIFGAYSDNVGGNILQGSAYIFVRSGTVWSQQQKLTAADGTANDWFGTSVVISGETAIVGAIEDDVGANANQGSAYIFVRSGTMWSQQQKLTASDGAASDRFGVSVAISGETAIVGAYFDNVGGNSFQGSAYVFTQPAATTTLPASSFTVLQGTSVVGGLAEIAASDDTYLSITDLGSPRRANPAVQVRFEAIAPEMSVGEIVFRIESHAFTSPAASLLQRIEMFNFVSGQWVTLSQSSISSTDSVKLGTINSGASDYVETGSRLMRARVTWFDQGRISTSSLTANTDHVNFTLGP